eukprot:m.256112 g.256112  ORF g.256112 m.256112 type:complete len:114 (+) comp15512_c4_seq1:18-359(+)
MLLFYFLLFYAYLVICIFAITFMAAVFGVTNYPSESCCTCETEQQEKAPLINDRAFSLIVAILPWALPLLALELGGAIKNNLSSIKNNSSSVQPSDCEQDTGDLSLRAAFDLA